MHYLVYIFFTLNGLALLTLGRPPITIDKTKHIQWRILGAVEMTLFPVVAAAVFITSLILTMRNPQMDEQTFLTQHRTTFRIVEYATIGVYFVVMLIWESAIRKRIAAGR